MIGEKVNKKTVENNNKYSDYNDFKTEKQLNHIFVFLFVLSFILNILIILSSKDICVNVSYAKCGFSYKIVNNDLFFIFMWIENILSIVFALYKVVSGIIDKHYRFILFGLIDILIQPVIWTSLLGFLNISW